MKLFIILIFIFCFHASALKIETKDSLSLLREVQSVTTKNARRVNGLLYDACESLKTQWNVVLIREVGRAINLSMRYNHQNYIATTEPFYPILKGHRKNEFVDIVLETLDEKHKAIFKEDVLLALSDHSSSL